MESGISIRKVIDGLKAFDPFSILIESWVWDTLWVIMDDVSFMPSFVWAIEAFITKITKLAAIKYFMIKLI